MHHGAVVAAKVDGGVIRSEEPTGQWSGGGNLLLVEDEDTVRMVAERALTRAGYTVTAARDGEEGLELVEAGGGV